MSNPESDKTYQMLATESVYFSPSFLFTQNKSFVIHLLISFTTIVRTFLLTFHYYFDQG